MTKKIFYATLAGAALMVSLVNVHAGMIIDNEPTARSATNSRATDFSTAQPSAKSKTHHLFIEHVGSMPSNLKRISFSMTDAPISKVLASMVPKGWSGYASDPRVKNVSPVSFKGGGRQWPLVLEEILKNHGLTAQLDWEKQELSVGVGVDGVR